MNLAQGAWCRRLRAWHERLGTVLAVLLIGLSSGCADQVRMPTADELEAFEQARSTVPTVDMDRIQKAKLKTGPYRVVPGDVLEFIMPALLQAVTAKEVQAAQARSEADHPYLCRVRDSGEIVLPAIGAMRVAGLSLSQIEEAVTAAYAGYVVLEPSVFVRVSEFKTSKVYITGAVEEPGVYTLQADQMALSCLLTEAGGIAEAGAALVRIVRSDQTGQEGLTADSEPILLPVVNTNIPFQDVALEEGDTVVVEQTQMPLFSVLGLVNKPGNFPYPPNAEYNLTQAIAYAGGFDAVAEPRYATIYRLKEDGSVARVPFQLIQNGEFTDALATPIRPGDVVAIEHTPRTRANTTIHNLVRINTGVYIQGRDLWD
ncbi:MAG TPA: SLBB domain-containing protein [Sedimentisphaerales bacterium]|nr:SLBB domain-containing protein [Sedimentisphaerales bacterium]HRV49951.1 SLBB domain-containing protein [Sedimentisphaerales bacterium]